MPKRKRTNGWTKKQFVAHWRNYKKRQKMRSYGSNQRVARRRFRSVPVGFPKKQLMKLRYVEDVNVPKYNAAPYCFGLNCAFKPNLSATGHQPRGFDQLAAIYDKYCVIAATAHVELLQCPVTATTGTDSFPTLFMHLDDNTANDGLTLPQHLELGMKGKYTIVARQYGATNAGGFALPKRAKSLKYGIRKFFGLSKKTQIIESRRVGLGDESNANSEYDALFTANPENKCVLKLKMFNTSGSDDAAIVRVRIDMTLVAFDPIELPGSS